MSFNFAQFLSHDVIYVNINGPLAMQNGQSLHDAETTVSGPSIRRSNTNMNSSSHQNTNNLSSTPIMQL